jgi:hypothetical protein
MFDAALWGTVGQWVSGIASSGALMVGASVLAVDLHRKRRAQASSVVAWIATLPGGQDVKITVQNLSDQPIFDYGTVLQPKPTAEVDQIVAANHSKSIPHTNLPPPGHKSDEWTVKMLSAHEGEDLDFVLAPGKTNSTTQKLDYSRRAYDFYVLFTDAYGRRWVRNARTNRLLGHRDARRIHPHQSKLRQIFDPEY